MSTVRVLGARDAPALEAFLARHADSSMFLRAMAGADGAFDPDQPEGTAWAAAFEGESVVAVAAHTGAGILVVQAPVRVEAVVRAARAPGGRPVTGINGPWAHVVAARAALGLRAAPARLESHEVLYALELARLIVPEPLAAGRLGCRHPRRSDLERLVEWRVGYGREALSRPDTPALARTARGEMERVLATGRAFVLVDARDAPLAFSAFNAVLPEAVQIGGVWTPPEARGRGYARAVVAGSLLEARGRGVTRSVLFTNEDNRPARRAYEALGFRAVGDYGLLSFE